MADRGVDVNPFSYTEETLEEIEGALSHERLQPYLDAAGGNRERALRLYLWNTAASAAFYGPLQGLEVVLRNAIHRQLSGRYGSAWYTNLDTGLDRGALGRIRQTIADLTRDGSPNDSPLIRATLSFGFWVSLLGSGGRLESGRKANYEMTLWRPALRQVFAHCATLTRRQAHGPLNELRILRNRIAHHEPIFMRNLTADHARILEVTGWISPGVRTWIAHHSRLPALLELPRGAGAIQF